MQRMCNKPLAASGLSISRVKSVCRQEQSHMLSGFCHLTLMLPADLVLKEGSHSEIKKNALLNERMGTRNNRTSSKKRANQSFEERDSKILRDQVTALLRICCLHPSPSVFRTVAWSSATAMGTGCFRTAVRGPELPMLPWHRIEHLLTQIKYRRTTSPKLGQACSPDKQGFFVSHLI